VEPSEVVHGIACLHQITLPESLTDRLYEALVRAAIIGDSQKEQRSNKKLQSTAKNQDLTLEQRLAALNVLTQTEKFQGLPAEERIIFFKDICNDASFKIGAIRQMVTEIQRELVCNYDSLCDVEKELLSLINKTNKEAPKHLSGGDFPARP
jgi:hypothetical protein